MGINLRRGRRHIDCGCFQSALKQTLSWTLVMRNVVLALLMAVALLSNRRASRSFGAHERIPGRRCPVRHSASLSNFVEHRRRRGSGRCAAAPGPCMTPLMIMLGIAVDRGDLSRAWPYWLSRGKSACSTNGSRPPGALLNAAGPGVGEPSPRLEVHALGGNSITVGGKLAPGRALLMLVHFADLSDLQEIDSHRHGFRQERAARGAVRRRCGTCRAEAS